MDDTLARIWTDLVGRLTGPLTLRLLLQPMMGTLFALRDGVKDARSGRPAYLWTIFSDAGERRRLLGEGWKAIRNVFVLAVILDVAYQWIVFRWVYPFEVLLVALGLAVLPYSLLRGPINRVARALGARPARS